MNGFLEIAEQSLVSRAFNGNPAESIVGVLSTSVIGGNLMRIISWYDNERAFPAAARFHGMSRR